MKGSIMKREQSAIVANVTLAGDMVNGSLGLAFANGKNLTIQLRDLSPELLEQAALHGLKQKLVDAAAISRNPDTGRAASIDDKYEAVRTVFDRLLSGSWNAVREGGSGASGGLLFRALCRMYEGRKTAEDIKEFLEGKSDAEKAALRKNPKIAAIIDTLRAEKGDGGNSEELLAELDD